MPYMRSHVSCTELVGFSKQDAHGNLVVASLPVNLPFSAFCRRFLLQTSVGLNTIHTFLSHNNPWTDTFFCDLGLAQLCSTAWVWNPQGTSKLVNRLIVACLMTASLCFTQGYSAGLPRYKSFTAKFLMYSCHMACVSKSVTKDVISLSDYVPNSTEAPWMRRAIVGTDYSASLSRNCQGQVGKLVLLWYCFLLRKVVHFWCCLCTWLPHRKGTHEPILHTRRVACEHRYLWTKKREFLVEDTWKVALVRSLLEWMSLRRKKISTANLVSTPQRRLVRLIPLLALKGCSTSNAWRAFLYVLVHRKLVFRKTCISGNLQIVS